MIEIRVPLEARRNPLLTPWTKSLVSFHCESSTVPEASKMKARSMDLRQAIKQRQETQQDTFEEYTWAQQSKQSITTFSAFDIYYSERFGSNSVLWYTTTQRYMLLADHPSRFERLTNDKERHTD